MVRAQRNVDVTLLLAQLGSSSYEPFVCEMVLSIP